MKLRNAQSKCTSAGRVTAGMLLSFLSLSAPTTAYFGGLIPGLGLGFGGQSPIIAPLPAQPDGSDTFHGEKRFTLRHIYHHGTYQHPELHRKKDIYPDAPLFMMSDDGSVKDPMPPLIARTQDHTIQRLRDRRPSVIDPMIAAAREQGEVWALSPSAWTIDNVAGPNITDKETVITLALMSSNAYVDIPYTGDWRDVNGGFNSSLDFGWENDGLRGHVFTDETNSTVVIGLKGTSVAVFDGAETTTGDKENDNLFFSCCCGQQGQWSWRQVCDCATSTFACNTTCVTKSLRKENRYYQAARELYSNVTALYPDSNIWLAGHSLGGSVSSLLGLTYGIPTTTFEAPGEAMAASRLGLPVPPGSHAGAAQTREFTGTHHFGHTADPIYMGTCNGASSSCSFAGYAMESVCHSGWTCEYDVVGERGWRVSVATHRIHSVIDDVLKMYDNVAECKRDSECVDCFNWKFFESNGTEGTTTSSSTITTKTRTRTETCKTPGWWGCLDETSTTTQQTSTSSTTTTTTSSTSTCKTPGWFGCRDEVTTTSKSSPMPTATTTSQPIPKPTTTCTSPGFFGGCNDPTSTIPISTTTCATPGAIWGCKDATTTSSANTITSPPTMPAPTHPSTPTTEHTCTSKEWFGLICVDPSPTNDPDYRKKKHHCVERNWLGFCRAYDSELEKKKEMRAYEI